MHPNRQPSTNSTAHILQEHLIPHIQYVSGFQTETQEVGAKNTSEKMSLLKNAFSVLYNLL